jgi:GWxTD domain-containing protein
VLRFTASTGPAGSRNRFLLLLALGVSGLAAASPAAGQNTLISNSSSGDISQFIDVVSFKNLEDPALSYVEIFYVFDRSQMTFIPLPDRPGIWSAAWDITTVIETEVGDQVAAQKWYRVSYDSTEVGTKASQDVYDRYPDLLLKPGVYRITTTLTDLNSIMSGANRVGVDERLVIVPAYSDSGLTISDIEFTARLGRASSQNMFVKNGLLVIPNPLRLYGVNLPTMSFYAEVYNLSRPTAGADPAEAPTYTKRVTIRGLNVDYERSYEARTRPTRDRNELVAETGYNVAVFPQGDYRLVLEVVDDRTGQRAVREKYFRVLNPALPASAVSDLQSVPMSEENIIRFRNEISYLATPEDLDRFDGLDPEGKRRFLIDFWKARDPDPETPQNEFRSGWVERFNYANKNFTTPTQPEGWKTDQGRVWIVYGKPDDVIPHPLEEGGATKPWVEWIYHQMGDQGRVRFIFADMSGGFGSYRLIHSTYPGEIHNPEWPSLVGVNIPPAF